MSLGLPDPTIVDLEGVQRNFDFLSSILHTGKGSPENVVAAKVGSGYLREDGGTGATWYVKETGGSGKTGWVAK